MPIHPLAVVDPSVKIGRDVIIKPFCVIEAGVTLGDGCTIGSHTVIKQGVQLGQCNEIGEGAVLGGKGQHAKAPKEAGGLIIGAHNIIREHSTLHRALEAGHNTVLGDYNLLMVNSHVAHDCTVGNHTIFANNATIGGHVLVEDRAFISGHVAVHQFCRVGSLAMIGGVARVIKDVPPFMMVDGQTGYIVGLNTVGLRRAGFTSEQIVQLKQAYRVIYRSNLSWNEVLERLRTEFTDGPAARYHEYLAATKRGIIAERRLPPGARTAATIKLPEDGGDELPLRKAG